MFTVFIAMVCISRVKDKYFHNENLFKFCKVKIPALGRQNQEDRLGYRDALTGVLVTFLMLSQHSPAKTT